MYPAPGLYPSNGVCGERSAHQASYSPAVRKTDLREKSSAAPNTFRQQIGSSCQPKLAVALRQTVMRTPLIVIFLPEFTVSQDHLKNTARPR